MPEAVVRMLGVAKAYGMGGHVVPALRGITLEIDQGEFVAVMGPSGSGKSTFLNLLGCLDKPSAGRYLFEGRDVAGLGSDDLAAIRNRKLGFVFQNFNLLARSSAIENVELPLIYRGMAKAERRRRVEPALATVGLGHRADHWPSQLSGGEQQRVAIARALVNGPSLILADEPTGALDSRTSLEIMTLFEALNRAGITIVMVTHEQDIAHHARRIVTFSDGRIVEDGRNFGSLEAGVGTPPNDVAPAVLEPAGGLRA